MKLCKTGQNLTKPSKNPIKRGKTQSNPIKPSKNPETTFEWTIVPRAAPQGLPNGTAVQPSKGQWRPIKSNVDFNIDYETSIGVDGPTRQTDRVSHRSRSSNPPKENRPHARHTHTHTHTLFFFHFFFFLFSFCDVHVTVLAPLSGGESNGHLTRMQTRDFYFFRLRHQFTHFQLPHHRSPPPYWLVSFQNELFFDFRGTQPRRGG